MPSTCNELLPDISPYIELFDQTAQLWAIESPQKARKMFDLLALRTMYQEVSTDYNNPIDWLIKDSVCYCSIKNKGELFTSNSKDLKTCLDKDLNKFVENAEKEYIKLKMEKLKKDKILKLTNEQKIKIEKIKSQATQDMQRKTNAEFKKKANK